MNLKEAADLPERVVALLTDPPFLHGGMDGHTYPGGCQDLLGPMLDLVSRMVGRNEVTVIETGAGLTTLGFLEMGWHVVSVSPDLALGSRIADQIDQRGLDLGRWQFIGARSELSLPNLLHRRFDVALMDGGRGWPTVFVDFCYLNALLRQGGVLLIDDVHLYSLRELVELLSHQPGFRPIRDESKLRAFVKEIDTRFLPDFEGEPYLEAQPKDWSRGPRAVSRTDSTG